MDIISYLAKNKAIELNNQQKQGIMSLEKNTLLLAVPGSGKTTVLVSRIANLMVSYDVKPEKILTLTYNKETARDMSARFKSLFEKIIVDTPSFSTIHSFCLSVMNYYSKKYRRPMPNIIEQARYKNIKAQVLRELYKRYNGDFISEDNYETLERLICYCKNMMLTKEQLDRGHYELNHFVKIFNDYEAYKRKNHFMDFDDMLTLTYDILEKFPDVLLHFQEKFDYINIDEAQDTSYVQHKIIELISQKSKVFMVGDEDQSIYSFRGAYPKALLQFEKIYSDSLVIKMEQNFRSNSDIVTASNEFIKQNRQRYKKEMYCDNQRQDSIQFIKLNDYSDQAKSLFNYIKAYPREKTLGVIYKNNESAIPVINLFYNNDIKFYIKEHKTTYFSSAVMRDIIAYIKVAIDGKDVDAFSQIYFKLGYSRGIFEFVKENIHLYDNIFETILRITSMSDYKRNQTRNFISLFPRILNKSPISAIAYIQTDLNYDSYIENRMADGFTKTNTYQKINTAKSLCSGLKTVYEFLDKVEALESDIKNLKNIDKNSNITLTTMHSSKGLEFDTVVMLDMIRDVIPSSDAVNERLLGNYDEYENETRLFYVAVTRAKQKLIIYHSRLINGVEISPSIYLSKLIPKDEISGDITGTIVEHQTYGDGVVLKHDGDLVKVDFNKHGIRTLSLSICTENNIINIKMNK